MLSHPESSVMSIWLAESKERAYAEQLAQTLEVPIVEDEPAQDDYVLVCSATGLALRGPTSTGIATLQMNYHLNPMWRRLQQMRQKDALLRRAVRGQGKMPKRVFDATAGLCRDALSLAALECDVIAFEQSKLVLALVNDGLRRAATSLPAFAGLLQRLRLVHGDCLTAMSADVAENGPPDVVFLDPMFPDRDKSASVKKEMALLHSFLRPPPSGDDLLRQAYLTGASRVLVKRPKKAPALAPGVVHQFEGKSVRFDLYLNPSV